MEKVRTNQGGIAICVRLRTGGEGVLDFPHFSAYVLCGWPPWSFCDNFSTGYTDKDKILYVTKDTIIRI